VATVADHGHHHSLVAGIIREHALESLGELEEVVLGGNFGLKHFRLDDLGLATLNNHSSLCVLVARESMATGAGRQEGRRVG
jgi:hypothetical protein